MTDQPQLRVLEGPKPAHLDQIVEGLERALEAAKRGEYEGGMLIFERTDSEVLTYRILGTRDLPTTLGRMRLLEDALIAGFKEPPE